MPGKKYKTMVNSRWNIVNLIVYLPYFVGDDYGMKHKPRAAALGFIFVQIQHIKQLPVFIAIY
ncbi:MAG: hypothetical protein JM58_02635 [Peptococcaceae bacterium BICA1-8]|nr:MAG: hypothetical protein JM58_02635 [Peptococcaceae bacterium BICA1-8]